jgi:plastocyanin
MIGMSDRTYKLRRGLIIGGLAIGLLVLAACAPGGAETPMATQASASGREAEVAMRNTTFQPEEITVAPGTTVTWTNEDSFPHTVTSGTRDHPTDMFDEKVPGGGSFSFTFEKPGTYEYFCRIHPGMSGVVVVEG